MALYCGRKCLVLNVAQLSVNLLPPMEGITYSIPPTPRAITAELFASTSEDILENVLLNYVLDTRQRFPDQMRELPVALQAHFIAFTVDAEVLNGGFNQLMFNSPEIAEAAAEAFELLEMPTAAHIAERAWHLYESALPRLKAAQDAGTVEAFMETYQDRIFDEIDQEYSAAQDDFRAARLVFIRDHRERFFHERVD
jgi:Domain of unknown function (DUF4375)